MTKDQFLNSWSKELAIESQMTIREAKIFIHAFYDKVVQFENSFAKLSQADRVRSAASGKSPWLEDAKTRQIEQ